MVCTAHRLQCKTQHFPKHKFPIHVTRNVQTQLKSTVVRFAVALFACNIPSELKRVCTYFCVLKNTTSVQLAWCL